MSHKASKAIRTPVMHKPHHANLPVILKEFMSKPQISAFVTGCNGEEAEYFQEKANELAKVFANMPVTYEQDGKGDEAIVYLHYFRGGMDWFITEKDMEDEQLQAFGYCDLGMGFPELGYVSIQELIENNVELDIHWTPKTLGKVKAARGGV